MDFNSNAKYHAQWHLHGGGFGYCNVKNIGAWELLDGYGDDSVVIGFADDGCLLSAVDADYSNKFIAAAFFDGNKLVTGTPRRLFNNMYLSGFRHGTALASIIASPLSLTLPLGVAPGCRLLPIRWGFNNGFSITQDGFQQMLLFVSDKIDVFVNCWSRLPIMNFNEETVSMIRTLERSGGRRGKGILFIWAAGNSGCPIDYYSDTSVVFDGIVKDDGFFYDGRASKYFHHSLVNIDNVLMVSSVDCYGKRSHYSCYGSGISICAPSNNKHRFGAKLYSEKGLTTRSADFTGMTNNFKGTSGSAAIVGGVAGLVISANKNLYATDVASIIKSTASKHLNFSSYPTTIFSCGKHKAIRFSDGVVSEYIRGEFDGQGWSPWFGYGLVNSCDAVKYAITKSLS
ncbi:S8 family serine peptidase [Edwardsiella ictaluri]|uniref:S8 family serine peptidase n=1 Tax=Edwardsiella ictaluri TaxID=67780 RepID=UPI00030AC7DE|nr:S8 family serine peptidase [Edwardsiella ictaluri]EKS7762433.1 S8 family serine peptidase [Edwardsiella ictaluri]EKS7770830.1 S8 family serine peptidase [Edwardsiella ictaluri]EKS7773974.1 S8 family serine peptidase [Edwardsiella ictaluri]EKS7776048.1 S8 family serine peptidase [Edwardsiella ictaluri]EKS7785953.1 S8 family serine peptidase [Edwardsiella ictaluri]